MDRKTTRRGNYESGSDYVLEYGELRFSFNEEDFAQRVEQAAVKLGFVDQGLSRDELDDLLDLAVSGEIAEPSSPLGEHINENWEDLVGPANRSLVHWIRRLVFRGAWLDQRVKEGELDVVFDEEQPDLRLRAARPQLGADRALQRAVLAADRLPALRRPALGARRRLDPLAQQRGRLARASARAAPRAAAAHAASSASSRSDSSPDTAQAARSSAGTTPAAASCRVERRAVAFSVVSTASRASSSSVPPSTVAITVSEPAPSPRVSRPAPKTGLTAAGSP